jgi:4-amino-4-deoxy-L-arabinose transferase-like glycosyltransferase
MFSPFTYLIILGAACFYLGCAAVVFYAMSRLIRFKRISLRLGLAALLAMPVFWCAFTEIVLGGEELNPQIESREQLIGLYSNGDQSLKLNADGTFEARGLFSLTSGTWSNRDWSLTLSNTGLAKPRIITRNGRFCIAPFYDGVDAPIGLILKKESD